MSTENFYSKLPAFKNFKGIASDQNYAPAPDDWWVFVADVTNSTVAVEQGRYKDVNTIGAAAIVVAHEVMGDQLFPFVFGGDGATMVVPPEFVGELSCSLIGLKELAKSRFDLDLRIGKVQVAEIIERGAKVNVGKMSLAGAKSMSIFSGGGLAMADKLIKEQTDDYAVTGKAQTKNLKRLSCRWNPIPSRSGRMVSLVVSATKPHGMNVIAEFVDYLDEIYAGDSANSNPISLEHMSYNTVQECVEHEKRFHASVWSTRYFLRYLEILAAVWIFRLNMPAIVFDSDAYAQSLNSHSDYRKFDDTLKMTIDCSTEQLEKIKSYLAAKREEGKLLYGLHDADAALMTCFVNGLGEGEHIHFIDGMDGGYFAASVQHKALNQSHQAETTVA